ncbi:OstA-like protein [Arcticibacterium luteifluviistationis]|uniref:OstA-like protein n=1 Tax=Arcticibacterium luteifluviistationis TaxID=1784714 RepID=UPI0013A6B37C|nr:OstA-like protein [Arcticibacterium luteifluviistationis]
MRYILFVFVFLSSSPLWAQKPLNPAIDKGPKSTIQLIKADSLVVNSGESQNRTFYGDVQFLHRGVYMNCRKAIHNSGTNNLVAYGKIKINQGDTLTITGDTLYYDGNTRIAKIQGKRVIMTDDEMTLESTKMNYNLNTDLAYYSAPGVIHQDSIQLSSKTGYYNTTTKIFNYFGDVEILHPDFVLCTDSLDYNSITKRADFISYTTITSPDGDLSATEGYYYTDTRKSKFYGRSLVENQEYTLEADTLNFDMLTEEGFGIGNVAFFSKKDSLFLNGDFGEKIASQRLTKMTGNTLMRSVTDGDTLYLRADYIYAYQNIDDVVKKTITIDSIIVTDSLSTDSLLTVSINDSISLEDILPTVTLDPTYIDSTQNIAITDTSTITSPQDSTKSEVNKIQLIIAHGGVKIYRNDFQAICDSLNYNLVDSIITFIRKPIIWSGDSQLEGDTITANMVNNKIKNMFLNQNSFVVAKDSSGNFNQIKGREILAFFDNETRIKQVDVDGNGESIYYALDDYNKLIGLNRVQCGTMRLNFIDRKVKRISFMGSPESKLIPPFEIKSEQKELPNFSWKIDTKPTKEQVIGSNFAVFPASEEPKKE